jgi:hypothetical protein
LQLAAKWGAVLGLVALTGVVVTSAQACHRFSHWYYPWRQRCEVASRVVYHPPAHYVEVAAQSVVTPPEKPQEIDQRTPEQIQEAKEHDAAVRKFHDEINALQHLLHGESE